MSRWTPSPRSVRIGLAILVVGLILVALYAAATGQVGGSLKHPSPPH